MRTITRVAIQSPPMDDSQLATAARTDAEAFAELYRRHVTRVYRYQMAHTGNAKDAEDLTSQTFVAAVESIRS
jgi:DNA-directed RNA polymerase specialized sigma24 family protein